jgi:hypothetical protein
VGRVSTADEMLEIEDVIKKLATKVRFIYVKGKQGLLEEVIRQEIAKDAYGCLTCFRSSGYRRSGTRKPDKRKQS